MDFFHSAEHLQAALSVAYGETSTKANAQFEKLRLVLRDHDDGVEKVIRSLIHLGDEHPGRKKIAKELRYFRNNRHRIRYAQMKAQNLPIGSGVVEAACQTLRDAAAEEVGNEVAACRRASHPDAAGPAQSDRFDRAWQMLGATYKREVALPDNVIALH